MKNRFLAALTALFCTLATWATEYVLVEGENEVKGFQSAVCSFTPQTDANVLIEAHEVYTVTYNGRTYEHQYAPGSGFNYCYEVKGVKAGTTIGVVSDFVWNSTSVIRITLFADGEAVPVEAVNVSPRSGSTFNWNSLGMVTVNFNKAVTFTSIKFGVGEYEANVDDVQVGTSLSCNVTNALNKALQEGILKAGDKFCVRVKGLCDANDPANLYAGTGDLVLEYVAPEQQHSFVGATVGEAQLSYMQQNDYQFLSYYAPDGQDGLFVLEFDGEVGKVGGVYMTMGNLDLDSQGKYHRSSLPYSIQGNRLFVDARGTLRTLAVLFPAILEEGGEDAADEGVYGGFDTEHVTLGVTNVVDVNGNAFKSDIPGSVGSYYFVMGYKELVDEAFIDGDNVADGDEVHAGQEISLWLSNADIKFDGITVTYLAQVANQDDEAEERPTEARSVTLNTFKTVPDALQGIIISFLLPDMPDVVPGSTIRVALDNASSTDGMPHYLYIEFKAATAATDISHVAVPAAKDAYRLSGMRAVGASRGIVIKNGKKVIGE